MFFHLKRVLAPFRNLLHQFWDRRLSASLSVFEDGRKIFSIYDFGRITRYRARSFESKEPETLRWISSFNPSDTLLDIGANIGLYSLYAAFNDINVVAIEPDALNYALLNLNIRINNYGQRITPYLIAAHDESKFSSFNISSIEWGGALNSFDNTLDPWGNNYKPVHAQGVYGTTLDDFLPSIKLCPTHIKIDVDGNELLILRGAVETLRSNSLQSILIELDESRSDYQESCSLILGAGFRLQEKTHASIFDNGKYSTLYNHIFIRI